MCYDTEWIPLRAITTHAVSIGSLDKLDIHALAFFCRFLICRSSMARRIFSVAVKEVNAWLADRVGDLRVSRLGVHAIVHSDIRCVFGRE